MLILSCHYLLTTRGYLYLPPVCYFLKLETLSLKKFLLKLLDDIRACSSLSRCLPASGFTPLPNLPACGFTPLPNLPARGFYTTSKSSGMWLYTTSKSSGTWLLYHFQIFRHVAFILATGVIFDVILLNSSFPFCC